MKRWIHATLDSVKCTIDSKSLAPYKGYNIEKTWETDRKGRPIKDSVLYQVVDQDDDWVGDEYRTLKEAHAYIDELVK